MNKQLAKLFTIANKHSRRVVGLMSGTSVDGLDVAVCQIAGSGRDTVLQLEFFQTVSYNPDQRNLLQELINSRLSDLENIAVMNEWIGKLHAEIVLSCLDQWKIKVDEIDLIASHGQTVYHAPSHQHNRKGFPNASLQLGDGDHIAVDTGIITISDFRQKHLAAGGEGAPLAAYGDFILFAKEDEGIILLNIGGIANFTFIPPGKNFSKVVCSDTGPGNTLMDAYMQQQFPGKNFDESGLIASKGQVNEKLLHALSSHDFFDVDIPKTTGREIFNSRFLEEALSNADCSALEPQDVMATLNYFSCLTICKAIGTVVKPEHVAVGVLVSGGGMRNVTTMENLKKLLPGFTISTTSEWKVNPDAKEAILFAVLANETVCGNTEYFTAGTCMPAVSMGKISLPG